jgi:3-dehydroquinate synthase
MAVSPASDLRITSRFREYEVHFTDAFDRCLGADLRPGDVVVLDRALLTAHGTRLRAAIGGNPVLEIEATEEQKGYHRIGDLIERLIGLGFRKQHRLVAVGGGITQDATAFIASILYRGVDWLFYPTTLLAQGDSCIGSKTSVNFGRFKNQLGGFYPPARIVIDPVFLRSLPESEVRSGLGEMAHYFLIGGEADFERYRADLESALTTGESISGLIRRSLEIKRAMVERDEFDRGPRQIFNYGHTFGHALESLTQYRIPHGIAVSYGMDLANMVSVELGLLDEGTRQRARAVLSRVWAGTPIGDVDLTAYENALLKDKKNADGQLGLILTRGFGDMFKQLVPLDDRFRGWLRTWFAEAA